MAALDSTGLLRSVRNLDSTRRFLLLGGVVALVAVIWLVSGWAGSPTFVTLYRELDLKESGAITENLGKAGIKARLTAGGTEVQVPVADLARARVSLAKDGLPSAGRPGLELFDKPTWGMTDFTQRVTYQRALEGELARTIGALRGVQAAQVHLVLPTPGPIQRLERPAGASVVLTLKNGATLPSDAVQGITYIVSNSVEGLSADNVAVMDDAGRVLSIPSGSTGAAGLTTRELEIQRAEEQHMVDKIEELLATVVGTGRARAQVSALMSFDKVDRTVETYDPNTQVIQNEQKSEPAEGAAADAPGAATVVNNTYQNSRKVEQTQGSVGNVQRLTVAVLLDEKALTPAITGKFGANLAGIVSMVRDAVGADSARGDRVSVLSVPFEGAAAAAAAAAGKPEKPGPDLIVVAERFSRPVVGIVALAVLGFVALTLVRQLGTSPAGPVPQAAGAGPIPASNGAAGNGVSDADLRRRLAVNGNGSNDRLESAALVVRDWLAES